MATDSGDGDDWRMSSDIKGEYCTPEIIIDDESVRQSVSQSSPCSWLYCHVLCWRLRCDTNDSCCGSFFWESSNCIDRSYSMWRDDDDEYTIRSCCILCWRLCCGTYRYLLWKIIGETSNCIDRVGLDGVPLYKFEYKSIARFFGGSYFRLFRTFPILYWFVVGWKRRIILFSFAYCTISLPLCVPHTHTLYCTTSRAISYRDRVRQSGGALSHVSKLTIDDMLTWWWIQSEQTIIRRLIN